MVSQEYFGQLIRMLEQLCPVSAEFEKALNPLIILREFSAVKNMLREGEVQQQIWFVASGLVREVSPSADTASGRTSWFWYEGDFVFAHPGFFAGLPSLVEVEVYAGTVLLELSRMDLSLILQNFKEGSALVETLRYRNQAARSAHISDLVNLKHAEMVRKYYQEHKATFLTARAKDIASFLGIKDNGIHRFLRRI
jgi:CRP-like cAMP-binding protein